MHPYSHAQSSVSHFGGALELYLPLHQDFDATKAAYGDWRHRALRHHTDAFDDLISRSAPHLDPELARRVCEQHLREDLGILASLQDWRAPLLSAPWMEVKHDSEARAARGAIRFGGNLEDTLALHEWFDSNCKEDPLFGFYRHHAWGLFEAEAKFGVNLRLGDKLIPTRVILEAHLREEFRRLPSAQDWLRNIKTEPWMHTALERNPFPSPEVSE